MFAISYSASEDIRKHIRAGGTWVPWKGNFLVLLVHSDEAPLLPEDNF